MARMIVVLVDDRRTCSDAAVDRAISHHLADSTAEDTLVILYVRPKLLPYGDVRLVTPHQIAHYYSVTEPMENLLAARSHATRVRYAAKITTEYRQAPWNCRIIEVQGPYLEATADKCAEVEADLLVVGSRGGSRWWRRAFSVSEQIQKKATCAVDVVITRGNVQPKVSQVVPGGDWADEELS